MFDENVYHVYHTPLSRSSCLSMLYTTSSELDKTLDEILKANTNDYNNSLLAKDRIDILAMKFWSLV